MDFKSGFKERLLNSDNFNFNEMAVELFRFQAVHNPIYKQYIELLNFKTTKVYSVSQIPYLPICFFKTHRVATGNFDAQTEFLSSGTTHQSRSVHAVADLAFYSRISIQGFEQLYGSLSEYIIIALLPSYYSNKSSSLIFMVNEFIKASGNPLSGFIQSWDREKIETAYALRNNHKLLLIGVSHALLEMIKYQKLELIDAFIMETGGMKGLAKEIPREELHEQLKGGFGVSSVHSEYGMTELLSQAYALSGGNFQPMKSMKICLREINDPFEINDSLSQGGINVIDLANVDSCAFIETEDIGRKGLGNNFQVIGRLDNSEARGCNLLQSY